MAEVDNILHYTFPSVIESSSDFHNCHLACIKKSYTSNKKIYLIKHAMLQFGCHLESI